MHGKRCIASGIGDQIQDAQNLDQLHALFVNLKKPLATKCVFDRYRHNAKGFFKKSDLAAVSTLSINKLLALDNDLEHHAVKIMPEIYDILPLISIQKGCKIAKMSGSGATCFGIFNNKEEAKSAELKIKKQNPEYFVKYSFIS